MKQKELNIKGKRRNSPEEIEKVIKMWREATTITYKTYTKEQVLNFAKYVWYTKSLKDTDKGLTDYFKEWEDMGFNFKTK